MLARFSHAELPSVRSGLAVWYYSASWVTEGSRRQCLVADRGCRAPRRPTRDDSDWESPAFHPTGQTDITGQVLFQFRM